MTIDLTSDMLTRIRNASAVGHYFIVAEYSLLNVNILKIFIAEGYIKEARVIVDSTGKKSLKVMLMYKGTWLKRPAFQKLIRVSKPGQRIFSSYLDFPKKISLLKYSKGIAVISTSNGVISHKEAIDLKLGGEIVCYIG